MRSRTGFKGLAPSNGDDKSISAPSPEAVGASSNSERAVTARIRSSRSAVSSLTAPDGRKFKSGLRMSRSRSRRSHCFSREKTVSPPRSPLISLILRGFTEKSYSSDSTRS